MKKFAAYRRDALRYRALESTEEASPWANVLGGHKHLATLADALVKIIADDHGDDLEEDAPTMGVSVIAAQTADPGVSKFAQRGWTRAKGKKLAKRLSQVKI
jgi:hypothetical protein